MWYKKFQKRCRWLVPIGLSIICIFSYVLLVESIPDKIRIVAGREETFDLKVPVTGEVNDSNIEVFTNHGSSVNKNQVHIDMNQSFTLKSQWEGKYAIACKLFGLLSLKEVSLEVIHEEMVVPCGISVGIYVQPKGILVIGTGMVQGMDGMNYEPAYHLIKNGGSIYCCQIYD